ncbi:hypothetical protein CBR_g19151 [Chara braunii]|uniref:Uncharacterized protein n=1 Tax=Chara braunii TaxID=69332 RepID=A0A388KXH6_CHABU|nr:hypothetical protein CBR_g19151 [Chara braunii]|eukprot:GBG74745.1 hypothetical protein CBR_g19151 [Chara braunii]
MLALHKTLDGAIKLVNSLRLPALAERLGLIVEERLEKKKAEAAASVNPLVAGGSTAGTPPHPFTGNAVTDDRYRFSTPAGSTPRSRSGLPSLSSAPSPGQHWGRADGGGGPPVATKSSLGIPSSPVSAQHRGRADGGGGPPSATRSSLGPSHQTEGTAVNIAPQIGEQETPNQPKIPKDNNISIRTSSGNSNIKEPGTATGASVNAHNFRNDDTAASSKAETTTGDRKEGTEERNKMCAQQASCKDDRSQENGKEAAFGSTAAPSLTKPSNPFAKRVSTSSLTAAEEPSTSGSTLSILDSVKKMQAAKVDDTGKRKLGAPTASNQSIPERPGKVRKTKRP